ncbi:hypothetical protein GQ457_04G022650 [Hibiscus cannabinus]
MHPDCPSRPWLDPTAAAPPHTTIRAFGVLSTARSPSRPRTNLAKQQEKGTVRAITKPSENLRADHGRSKGESGKKGRYQANHNILDLEHFEITQQKGPLFSYFNFHSRWINDFIPTDSSNIEWVYVPLNHKEGKDWFLLVIDIVERRNYVLDYLGFNDERKNIARDILIKSVGMFGCQDSLGRLFKNVADFVIDFLELSKQPNSDDCGMHVLKFIETNKK